VLLDLPWKRPLIDHEVSEFVKGEMVHKRPQTIPPFALKCGLLFLAFSVFSFGLSARLSLYRVHQSPGTVAAAKLSADKRTAAQSSVVLKVVKEPLAFAETLRLVAIAASHDVVSSPAFMFHQVEVSLCSPCRFDSRSSSLMNRPPPTLS